MRRILVTSPERGVIGEIFLAGDLAELLGAGSERSWGRHLRLLRREEDLIELTGLEDADPRPVLTDLQNGLLYAEIAGMRLEDTPDRPSIPSLSAVAGRVELQGGRGRSAILALWDRERESRGAAEFAAAQGYTALTLTRVSGRAKHRTRLSVLFPERYAERALEEMTAFQLARARPVLLAGPAPAPIARTAPRQAPARPVPVIGEGGPASDWGRGWPVSATAPRLEIDRIALDACGMIVSGRVRGSERVWGAIASALYDCWRLGSGRKTIPVTFANHLKELARAVEVATGEDRDRLDLLSTRQLIRACGSEAWALGTTPKGRPKAPPPRFREECCLLMRPIPAASRTALIDIAQGETDRPLAYDLVEPLIERGYLDRHRMLTAKGLAAVGAELARIRAPLPSIRSLLAASGSATTRPAGARPDEETAEARPPGRSGARSTRGRKPRAAPQTTSAERTEREIAPLLLRVESLPADPPGPDGEDPFRLRALPLLQAFWRVGRYGPEAFDREGRVTGASGPFLAERARVIAEMTRERRARGDALTARALMRASGVEAWRIGMIAARGVPLQLPPRFREECSAPMRDVPDGVRWAVIALHQGAEHRYRKGVIGQLSRAGLVEAGAPPRLTEAGTRAAVAELTGPWTELPSILSLVGEEPPLAPGPRWPAPRESVLAPPTPEPDIEEDPLPPPDPLRGDAFTPDAGVRERIAAMAADDCDRYRPGNGANERFRALIEGTLLICWRMGRDPEGSSRRKPPPRVGHLVRERARVIETVSRTERGHRDLALARDLLTGSALEMWRYGALLRDRPRSPLPARYREECSEPMRPAPTEARDRLLSLLERRTGRPMRGAVIGALVREGLLEKDGLTLTVEGRLAARTERGHRTLPLPSILSLADQDRDT